MIYCKNKLPKLKIIQIQFIFCWFASCSFTLALNLEVKIRGPFPTEPFYRVGSQIGNIIEKAIVFVK